MIEVCQSKLDTLPEFPMGWWSVSKSHELAIGEVKSIRAMDRELVLYRTRSGVAQLADAYCPHLGANLGVNGRVIGEAIQCPFHGWQFGSDGKCVKIPYCEDIPERAEIYAWHCEEANGEIYMWYHPEGLPPQYEIPIMEEFDDKEWTEPRYAEFEIPIHIQDIAENVCDPVHFQYVHSQNNVPPSDVSIDDDGRHLHLHSDMVTQSGGPDPHHLHSTVYQPGLARVHTIYAPNAEMVVFNSSQPIDRYNTRMRWSLVVRREIEDLAGDEIMNGIIKGLDDDAPIWGNKVHKRKPVFCKGDETLVTYRKWVKQFYHEQYPAA